mmetsp:Transcript_5372/g.8234  ORF Transcript_5372/g.8234 Transcript_5372/m.8234 type:complete len:554 (+) Transcript_5372:89-1750(+)
MQQSSLEEEGDDNSSSGSSTSYQDPSSNDLTLVTGALLLTADCMGTGILALPADVQTLGQTFGLVFLLLNLPVNLYAGTILSKSALFVEDNMLGHSITSDDYNKYDDEEEMIDDNNDSLSTVEMKESDKANIKQIKNKKRGYSSVNENDNKNDNNDYGHLESQTHQQHHHSDTATFDFVGLTSMLFDRPILRTASDAIAVDAFELDNGTSSDERPSTQQQQHQHHSITYKHSFTKVVLAIYYINLFLVLSNYTLVMSHSVKAMAGDNICLPTAGIFASLLMFGLSQVRTMANLGRSISAVSLAALFIVVVQCLYALRGSYYYSEDDEEAAAAAQEDVYSTDFQRTLAKMSAVASIGFAVGSQKLLLNIRHEMKDRKQAAPGSLSISLSLFGLAYVTVCLLAGPNPPSFLFDAIPAGTPRRLGGALLWIHVAVSYAINSQAFCSSVERVVGHKLGRCLFGPRFRWTALTGMVALASYIVANSIPFFKDLVSLCGALTSIPLTLILPAILYRRLYPSKAVGLLLIASTLFMIVGLIGAVGSINVDKQMRAPFSCN